MFKPSFHSQLQWFCRGDITDFKKMYFFQYISRKMDSPTCQHCTWLYVCISVNQGFVYFKSGPVVFVTGPDDPRQSLQNNTSFNKNIFIHIYTHAAWWFILIQWITNLVKPWLLCQRGSRPRRLKCHKLAVTAAAWPQWSCRIDMLSHEAWHVQRVLLISGLRVTWSLKPAGHENINCDSEVNMQSDMCLQQMFVHNSLL